MAGPLYGIIYGRKYSAAQIPSQKGKVALVTGGNTGIGYETVKELVRNGAKVYLAARNEQRANAAISKLQKELEGVADKGTVEWLPLDLCSLASTKQAAETFAAKEQRLDVLVNNAGIMATSYKKTGDNLEEQFQTNHVAHFLLTRLLIPRLEAADAPRVVNVSSLAHKNFPPPADCFSSEERANSELGGTGVRYGQSKAANVLFTQGLSKRYPKLYANSLHPGVIASELYKNTQQSYGNFVGSLLVHGVSVLAKTGILLTPAEGALTQLYLATAPQVTSGAGIRAQYFEPIAKQTLSTPFTRDEKVADQLWDLSEKILADRGYKL
ncbi:hypothetical protein PYCC9005_000455 [Savitreella phatthalungensis]